MFNLPFLKSSSGFCNYSFLQSIRRTESKYSALCSRLLPISLLDRIQSLPPSRGTFLHIIFLNCPTFIDYRGILACLDGYMNIAMEQTEEYVNGQLKNKYGDAFIRGNNVLYISTTKRTLGEGA
ncbi:unnamed protein product [Fraxinus pennsylvanica]|uniref:Sm domain-containing protein n=1 Tax=Fraxinus pennsylvanica TaxID=56036 RepID=A0AAD1Z2N7_9LAMI|nr:unnamed protein product [Fraxinus pennsylvanica]